MSSVLSAYADQGNDIMIDYDHAALSPAPIDPALSSRAAGWCHIEQRGGELWAVNVRWTPAAQLAIESKEWRYISPAFETDEQGRITALMNIAITNLPATKKLTPLIAANMSGDQMTPEQFAAIAEALGLGADANIEDVIATIAAMVKKVTDAAGDKPAEEAPAAEEKPAEEKPVEEEEVKAASQRLCRLSGRGNVADALAEVEVWKASHLAMEADRVKLAKEREALEASERRRLVAELVKLGAETPATAWSSDRADKPCKRLAAEPLGELRERVQLLSAARVAPAPKSPSGPLSDSEQAAIRASNANPDLFVALKARREAARMAGGK